MMLYFNEYIQNRWFYHENSLTFAKRPGTCKVIQYYITGLFKNEMYGVYFVTYNTDPFPKPVCCGFAVAAIFYHGGHQLPRNPRSVFGCPL